VRLDRLRIAVVGIAVVVLGVLVALIVTGGDDDGDSVAAGRSTSTAVSSTSTTEAPTTTIASTSSSTVQPAAAAATTRGTTAATPSPPVTTAAPSACRAPARGSDFAGFGATEIVIQNSEGTHRSCVLAADTPAQRERGLMGQDDLDGYDGMIFRYPDAAERSFWMRNTRIPLSIAYFGAGGEFVSARDMEPCGDSADCPGYPSNGPAKYALEVIQGRLPAVGATSGSQLTS
jgi:uncharacterized membrane protein (UPF0127 family)